MVNLSIGEREGRKKCCPRNGNFDTGMSVNSEAIAGEVLEKGPYSLKA